MTSRIDLPVIAIVYMKDSDALSFKDADGRRYFRMDQEPLLSLKGQPMRWGLNPKTNKVEFYFLEGADLSVVMRFKLQWGA